MGMGLLIHAEIKVKPMLVKGVSVAHFTNMD